jgi:hypothetical protein
LGTDHDFHALVTIIIKRLNNEAKGSPIEDLLEIATKLPWWAGLLLALISYLLLHQLAVSDTAPFSMETGKFNIAPTLFKTIATFGQYIIINGGGVI